MITAILRLPLSRLTRTRRAWFAIVGWTVLAVIAAFVAHERGSPHAADHVLVGPCGGIALPLLAYGIVGALVGAEGLARSGAPLVRFGAPPGRVALLTVIVGALAGALLGAFLLALAAAVAHGAGDPPLFRDIGTSAYVGALGGAAYATLFAFGGAFGARGGGRTIALVLDYLLGSGAGSFALVTPRAHLRNLLGGAAPLEVAQRTSAVVLALLLIAFAALAVARGRRSVI